MLHQLSTSTRLILLGLGACLAIAFIGLMGDYQLSSLASLTRNELAAARDESRAMVTVKSAQSSFLNQIQEWKNILVRGNDPESFRKYKKAFDERSEKTQTYFAQAISQLKANQASTDEIEALRQHHRKLTENYLAALEKFDPADPQTGKHVDALVKGMDRTTTAGMNTLVDKLEQQFEQRITEEIAKAERQSHDATQLFWVVSLISLFVVAILSITIRNDLMRELGGEPADAANAVRQIAAGNLNIRITTKPGDDNSLLASMKHMQEALHTVIREINNAATSLVDAAQGLASTSHQVAASSHQQSASSAAMAAAIEQMTVSINQVADNAQNAHQLARNAQTLSNQSGQLVEDTIHEINTIANSVQASTRVVYSLGEHSNKISGIANVIKEIADQTNLLALNAAIEAARAGEAGRGFAVVADEVRKLAEKTTLSTQEIAEMILAIQNGTQIAIRQMEDGSRQVEAGVHTAAATGHSMKQIENGSGKVLEAVDEMAEALREQSTTSEQIALNIEQVAQMTEENSAAVEEVSGAAVRLQQLASAMKLSIARFQL